MALTLAQKYEPEMAEGLAQSILQGAGQPLPDRGGEVELEQNGEHARVRNAREQSQEASQPDEGKVVNTDD
jgi:hypothetical protein